MSSFLIIQTAFIGDVILATPIIEKIHQFYPDAKIDFLVRKGNEGLLENHPYLNSVKIWDKKNRKYKSLLILIKEIRAEKYDYVINAQRFLSTGLITVFSHAKTTIGFDKNPLSFLYKKKVKHVICADTFNIHEVNRNISLISSFTNDKLIRPALYPSENDFASVRQVQPYICIAPTSIWLTKQLPPQKWIEFIKNVGTQNKIILTGSAKDFEACEYIKNESGNIAENLAGKLTFMQSAALMKNAVMNYVNDSAPMHIASSMNAPVTAVFCSTVPQFGFGPLSDSSNIIEVKNLSCRPCGLHGFKACPKGHFKCSDVNIQEMVKILNPF